ncbi:unnamed protein product [Rotaria sp. Silwood1]|nr:unnamed protein product [Rotaria sp. Silwood1]
MIVFKTDQEGTRRLPFSAFIEAFFLLSQRKFPSAHSLLDSVSQLVNVCVRNLNTCLQAPSSPLIQQSNQYLLHRASRINSSTNQSSMNNRSTITALRSTITATNRTVNVPSSAPIKGGNLHRALDDIYNSIEELRYYQKTAFKQNQIITQYELFLNNDITKYLIWININSTTIIHCILTDSNLNIIDEIIDGKTDDDLMKIFSRNEIYQEKLIVVAGKFLGPIRAQLKKLAPQFNEFCHYRSIDIDVISILCEKWFPNIYEQRPVKDNDDNSLKNSIELLRFYRSTIFK